MGTCRSTRTGFVAGVAGAVLSCAFSGSLACSKARNAAPATTVNMHFARAGGFFDAPFPSDDLRAADGTVALPPFPNPNQAGLVSEALALASKDARGFAQSGGVFFTLSGAIDDTQLPSLAKSATPDAPVFLVSVDDKSSDFGKRYPVDVAFDADGGPFGAPNLLSIVPLQGIPLRPGTTYAAVVLKRLRDASGAALGVTPELSQIESGQVPESLSAAAFQGYTRAIESLAKANVPAADIAGLTVFTTDTPAKGIVAVKADILSRPLPKIDTPFTRTDTFPTFCVYQSTLAMPVYQQGTPPYDTSGGTWAFDAGGKPLLQRMEKARVVLTVPRKPMPATGFPVAVLVRTGAGGDRPLVDRGPHATAGGPAITPGTGPALEFAAAGFAGLTVDGPLGGLRNPTQRDEQFLVFNIFNAGALRDNIRQSAVELTLVAHIVPTLTVDVSDCPGGPASAVTLDASRMALMGHSMGAWFATIVLANEPAYGAAILSGGGASWITNVLYKEHPVQVRTTLEGLLGYTQLGRHITESDPLVTLFQWAEEPADPLVYARYVLEEPRVPEAPRHILMEQGIVDHYILPPIANALSLSLGLDLVGDELDATPPELASLAPLSSVLAYSGRSKIAFPVTANVRPLGVSKGPSATAVVVQHPSDGIEDGHEIVFQTDAPKREIQCYLEGFGRGVPTVIDGRVVGAACP